MIHIGAPTPSREPLGLLTDCHRRIETALASLVSVAAGPSALDDARLAALVKAQAFFHDMAPKHTADEEQSLFPRLRARGLTWPELDALEREHQEAEALHSLIDRTLDRWLAARLLDGESHAELQSQTQRLAELYARHIRVEDGIVFPRACAELPLDEQEAVRREMVARRAVQIAPFPPLQS